MDTGDEPSTEPPDYLETFLDDLARLRSRDGNAGYKVLGRRMGLSHSSVHSALNRRDTLPSEYVLMRMIAEWDPGATEAWLTRRRRLARHLETAEAASEADAPQNSEIADPPLPGAAEPRGRAVRRAGRTLLIAAGVCVVWLVGAGLATPMSTGGVDVYRFCTTNYDGLTGAPPAQNATHTWSDWVCLLQDGRQVPVDMGLACREQHPPLTPLGRTFADHVRDDSASWRCYTDQVNLGG